MADPEDEALVKLIAQCRTCRHDTCLQAADTLQSKERTIAELRGIVGYFISRERSIKIDIGARHKARLRTADDLTVAQDADFRSELEAAFDNARKALGGSNV